MRIEELYDLFRRHCPTSFVMPKDVAIDFLNKTGHNGVDVLRKLGTDTLKSVQYLILTLRAESKLNQYYPPAFLIFQFLRYQSHLS